MRAFGEGVLAGFGIAIPVGPIAVLIVDLGMRRGPRLALAAGLGAATADFLYASIAAVARWLPLAPWRRTRTGSGARAWRSWPSS